MGCHPSRTHPDPAAILPPIRLTHRNDGDILAEKDVVENLMKLLDANGEDATRVTGLRAIHALAARSGDILRHRVRRPMVDPRHDLGPLVQAQDRIDDGMTAQRAGNHVRVRTIASRVAR